MLRSRWILLLGALVLCGGWAALHSTGFGERDLPAGPQRPSTPDVVPRTLERLAAKPPRQPLDTGPAQSAVAEFRRRQFSPEPRSERAPQIAISGPRVGRLDGDTVVVVEPQTNRAPLVLPLAGALQLVSTLGGLVAVGSRELVHLENGSRQPQRLPRVTVLPGSTIFADLIRRDRLWVRHGSANALYGYELAPSEAALLPLAATFELPGAAGSLFTALPDGSFVHLTSDRWQRLFVQGKRFELSAPRHGSPPFRLLGARRVDQFFVVYRDGLVQRLQIADRLRVVWSRRLERLPVDIVTSGDSLVLLDTRRRDDGELEWFLEVIRAQGPTARVELGTSDPESFRGDWHAGQLRTRGLAASTGIIALGGGPSLAVWEARTLEPLLLTTASPPEPAAR